MCVCVCVCVCVVTSLMTGSMLYSILWTSCCQLYMGHHADCSFAKGMNKEGNGMTTREKEGGRGMCMG